MSTGPMTREECREAAHACSVVQDAILVDRVLKLDLWYPAIEAEPIKKIEIDQMSVRASDSIRVSYDYDRDGWVIEQAAVFEWKADDEVRDREWGEVAFIKAWGRAKDPGLQPEIGT